MEDSVYKVPARASEATFTDRRSEFIAHLCPVKDEEDAKAFVAGIKNKYSDARHNVWAYTLHDGTVRSSDDGEPAGTAGAPILECLTKKGLTDAAIVVTRYFGGILLGTGGLVHAYTTAAAEAVSKAGSVDIVTCFICATDCSFAHYGKIERLLRKYGGKIVGSDFATDVHLEYILKKEMLAPFERELTEMSAGKLTAAVIGEKAVAEE